jgi:hypothetical protein
MADPESKPTVDRRHPNKIQLTFNWSLRQFSLIWDFVDQRQIDRHAVCLIVLYYTGRIVEWALEFVDKHPEKPGIEVAAILGAVMMCWNPVLTVVIKWFFVERRLSNPNAAAQESS